MLRQDAEALQARCNSSKLACATMARVHKPPHREADAGGDDPGVSTSISGIEWVRSGAALRMCLCTAHACVCAAAPRCNRR